ncbi:MAG: hypothetical protein ACE5PT_11510 [Gemmatimonadales bacterium]
MRSLRVALGGLAGVLVDPVGASRAAVSRPYPVGILIVLGGLLVLLGAGTIPRQLFLLERLFGATGDPLADLPRELMRGGLVRLIVADRLVPSPTIILAALLLGWAVEPVLALARDRRRAIWAVVLLSLAPLIVARLGELAVTYLISPKAAVIPADAIQMPHRFLTGPLLAWRGADPAPAWLELLDARFNLIVLWCIALWAVGLRELDGGGRWAAWHWLLPVSCVAGGAVATWILGPLALTVLLRGP